MGALYTPGTAVLTRPAGLAGRRMPLHSGQSLHPDADPPPELLITRHHQGFTAVHPSGLPLACGPRVEQEPLGFSPSFTPHRYRRRMSGWGQALSTA
jgi:hypothetical protein